MRARQRNDGPLFIIRVSGQRGVDSYNRDHVQRGYPGYISIWEIYTETTSCADMVGLHLPACLYL